MRVCPSLQERTRGMGMPRGQVVSTKKGRFLTLKTSLIPLVGRKSAGKRHLGRFLGVKTPRQALFQRWGHQARPAGIGMMHRTGIMPQPDHGQSFRNAHFKGPHGPGVAVGVQGHALDAQAAA